MPVSVRLSGATGQLIPALAAETPTYDADELSYTVKLRKDIFFQDDRCFHEDARGKSYRDSDEGEGEQGQQGQGRNLVAEDIAYSFKRLAALPDSGGFWVIEGQIKGLDEFRNEALKLSKEGRRKTRTSCGASISTTQRWQGWKVIDDYTIN